MTLDVTEERDGVQMQTRILGRAGRPVSVIGLGTWQLGADWGEVDPADARDVLEASRQAGVAFCDTADVYGDGRDRRFRAAVHARW
jgi:aryl-alcohol dehydrogenase-like predicted oxidoreductase